MSNGIYAHFYLKTGRRAPSEIFAKMVGAMTQWEEAENKFKSVKAFDATTEQYTIERYGTFSAGEMIAATRGVRGRAMSIWSDLSFRCWHTAGGRPFQGIEGSTLIARGSQWWGRHAGDHRLRGNAELTIWERAPFTILDVNEFGPGAESWNAHVEENLEILTSGMFRIIDALKPASMKVYDGFGDFLPLNANMVYYRNEAEVIADLRFMAEIWERGEGRIPPLKNGYSRENRGVFGALRSEASRERLWRSMMRSLPYHANVTERTVRAVMNSGRFDYYAMPVGFTVLDHPGYMNSYVHEFYLAVLDAAK